MKVLFVCKGNICRSPTAEAIFKSLAKKKGFKSECDSCGIIGFHAGEKADFRSIKHAQKRGYVVDSISRKFIPEIDFKKFDLILAMDFENIDSLQKLDENQEYSEKIHLITEYSWDKSHREVPDPYYGNGEGFDLVISILEKSCEGLLRSLTN